MAKTVVGIFDDYREAQSAVQDLVNAGVSRDQVSLVANREVNDQMVSEGYDHTASNVGTGAGVGAAIGGAGGLLLSLAGLAIPGIGPVLAAGPLVAALSGAGVGAAIGGIVGGLTSLGVPEHEAHFYAEGVRRGQVLVTAHVDDTLVDRASDIMDDHGAVDVDERITDFKQTGWNRFDESAAPYDRDQLMEYRNRYRRDTVGSNVRDAGNDISMGAREVGHDVAQGTREAAFDAKQGAREVAHNVAQGTREVGHDVAQGARNLGHNVAEGARELKEDVRDTFAGTRRRGVRIYDRP